MNAALMVAPLLAAVLVVGLLIVSIIVLWTRYLHPLQLVLRALGAAGFLGVIGLTGVLPSSLWWAMWLLVLLTVGGVARACRRLLVGAPPSEPTKRQAKHLKAPHPVTLVVEIAIYVAIVAAALYAG